MHFYRTSVGWLDGIKIGWLKIGMGGGGGGGGISLHHFLLSIFQKVCNLVCNL